MKQVISKCETYNDRGQPIGAMLTYDDRSMETWAYAYLKADRYSRLLGWKRIFEDGTLKRAVMYEYGYRE